MAPTPRAGAGDEAEPADAPAKTQDTALLSQLEEALSGSVPSDQGSGGGPDRHRKRDYPVAIDLVRGAADFMRGMEERVREAEARIQDLVQRTAHEIKTAEARVETAETRARAAEARAAEAERRAREAQDWLDQILNVITEELKR